MKPLKVSTHKIGLQIPGNPEIANINYDLWRLIITLNLNEQKQLWYVLDRIICLLCVYICHYIFPFYYFDIFGVFFYLCLKKIKKMSK